MSNYFPHTTYISYYFFFSFNLFQGLSFLGNGGEIHVLSILETLMPWYFLSLSFAFFMSSIPTQPTVTDLGISPNLPTACNRVNQLLEKTK